MSVVKTENVRRDSPLPVAVHDASRSPSEPCQSPSSSSPEVPVPSFIQASHGGLVAGNTVLTDTIFGPYLGTLRRVPPIKHEEDEEIKATVFKIQDSAGQDYTVDMTDTESDPPWWACIKRTSELSQANVALFSHGGALYLRILKEIAKAEELQIILTTPIVSPDTNADMVKTSPKDNTEPVTMPAATPMTTPMTTPSIVPISLSVSTPLSEGPPFKCNFCCIEFRNPSNLEAHRVYYCPGTATKPLPSSRRRSTAAMPVTSMLSVKTASAQATNHLEAPIKKPASPAEALSTFVCQLCQSSFESRSNCESHMLLLHCDESANLCKFCNYISGDRKGLCQHVFSHVREVAGDMTKCPADGQGTGTKMTQGMPEDDGDEKENRYKTTELSKSGNILPNDHTQSVSSPYVRHVGSSLSEHSTHAVSHLSSPEDALSRLKEERCSSAEHVKTESPGVPSVVVKNNPEPAEEDIVMSCPQCDFVTSRESVLLKHVTHHNSLRKKAHDRSTVIQAQRGSEGDVVSSHSDTKCHQCNIVFMSKKNYAAHKQYYCASRHADSISPPAVSNMDSVRETVSSDMSMDTDQVERNSARTTVSSLNQRQEGLCLPRIVSPSCSPPKVDHSPRDRDNSLHRTSRVSRTPPSPLVSPSISRSSSHDRLFDRPLRMVHLDGSKPHFLPPGSVLQGSQLVLVTPIVVPQSLGSASNMDTTLKVPTVKPSRVEQPLDLSTKPKTPPLSDVSGSDTREGTKSSELQSQISCAQFRERQSNRCEECEISFSKKESLIVHKQYYCASRHVFTPRGLGRTKQYGASKLPTPKSRAQSESPSPEQLYRRSPNSDMEVSGIVSHNMHRHPKNIPSLDHSAVYLNSTTVSVDARASPQMDNIVSYASPSQHSSSSTSSTPLPSNGNSTSKHINLAGASTRDHSNHRLKRSASNESAEYERERTLPPIKRKRNLIVDMDTTPPSTVSSANGRLTNGVIVKQEPRDTVSVRSPCNRTSSNPSEPLEQSTDHSQHPTPSAARRSSSSSKTRVRTSPTATPNEIRVKQEPGEGIPSTNGHSAEMLEPLHLSATDETRLPAHREAVFDTVNSSSRPPLIRHPITAAVPLTIPVYRHDAASSRQPAPPRLMTVNSYLNTGTSRPLLRGLKPTVKHCRNCNISFSSLSTFIAHKKYYCASHHPSKNAAL